MTRYVHVLMCGHEYVSSRWQDTARCAYHGQEKVVVRVDTYKVDADGKRITAREPASMNGRAE